MPRRWIGAGLALLLLVLADVSCASNDLTPSPTVMDSGMTTLATIPPSSVPALPSGITPEQIKVVVAGYSDLGVYSGISTNDVEVTDCKTFEDWAAAKLDIRAHGQVRAVFIKLDGAWHLRGLGVKDADELRAMDAPAEAFEYFGL